MGLAGAIRLRGQWLRKNTSSRKSFLATPRAPNDPLGESRSLVQGRASPVPNGAGASEVVDVTPSVGGAGVSFFSAREGGAPGCRRWPVMSRAPRWYVMYDQSH